MLMNHSGSSSSMKDSGSLPGHAIPGSFFFAFGLWYTIANLRRHFMLAHHNKQTHKSLHNPEDGNLQDNKEPLTYATGIFPCFCCSSTRWQKSPVEAYLKLACCVIGMCIEGIGFLWGDVARMQHFTMYAFFGLASVIDIVGAYMPLQNARMVANVSMALNSISYAIEGMLFAFHLHGRSVMNITMHTLLVYACFACAISFIVELRYPTSIVACLARGFFVMLQGTWFWQAGILLYPVIGTKWDESSHKNAMFVVVLFAWHAFGLLVLQGLCAMFVYKRVLRNKSEKSLHFSVEFSGVNSSKTVYNKLDEEPLMSQTDDDNI